MEHMIASPTEEKKTYDEKKYAIVTKETIKMMAEAAGHSDLSDSAAALLGEDVSYRLREAAMNCCQYMRHAKRKRLTTEDFNKALRHSDVQPVLGHGSVEAANFRQTRDGDLFFVEDHEVNLASIAFNSDNPKHIGETTIKAHWLAVEGIQKTTASSQTTPDTPVKKELSDDLMKYYENMTKAILGYDVDIMKVALSDLRSNPNIVPLLPYFVNFVSNGVKTVSHDLCQLTKLLHTVKALVHNPNIYLEPHPYLNLLIQAVIYCVLEPLAASINSRNDHWILRDYAARILAQIVNHWSSPLNHLRYNTEKNLKETLHDLTKPLCSHYGAVMGILSLGCKQVEEIIIPHLSMFMPHLSSVLEDISAANAISRSDAHKVYGALLLCAELVLKRRNTEFDQQYFPDSQDEINNENTFSFERSTCKKTHLEVYTELYEYFGDSLSIKLPEPKQRHMFEPEKKDEMVKLFDTGGTMTGEEMLEDFLEQVRIQQKLDKERREREERERREREKIEKERRERERIEKMKRDEEERRKREQEESMRQVEEQEIKKKYEDRPEDFRKWYEEIKRQQFEKQKEFFEENKQEVEMQQLWYQGQRQQQQQQQQAEVAETGRRRRVPVITYPNEDEEDSDDFLEDSDKRGFIKVDNRRNVSAGEGVSRKRGKYEEESDDSDKSEGESQTLAVRTISDPNQGTIKLKIKKLPPREEMVADKPVERHKDKDSKHKRKRKQTLKSSKEHDPFDFDKSDSDYAPRMSFTPSHIYSSPGGESSGSESQTRKSKLTLKLKVPSKESMSE